MRIRIDWIGLPGGVPQFPRVLQAFLSLIGKSNCDQVAAHGGSCVKLPPNDAKMP